MNLDRIKQGFDSLMGSLGDGWQRLRQSAGALIHFEPSDTSGVPAKSEVDDDFYLPAYSWSMLSGDVFEDEKQLVVRLEIPGLTRDDIRLEVEGDALVVSGEKRFAREQTEGRYRVLQCAYGSFRRVVPLPVAVVHDQSKATYADGVLRVELPKVTPGIPERRTIPVQ